ncbi:diguanylate cyclase [Undibacterium jejuense]|uniref:Diguanylate cyclase n=1 Tax=Undibacterium jejuense TaxID=1344949 RepID=A0A923HMX7_9BURK|nr:diguanylate cyclase [Undibacterium jejuense]MBC3862551.1 diguanylate cyclase [Undibacterium jejuense]
MHFLSFTHGLKFRLIAVGLLFIFFGSVIRYNIAAHMIRNNMLEVVSAQQSSLATYVALDINEKVLQRQQLLEKTANEFPLPLLTQPAKLEAWLQQRQEYSPLFSQGMVVVPKDGKGVIVDYPHISGRHQLDFNERDWFIAARDGADFYIGKPGISRATHQGVVNMSVPIKDDGGHIVAVLMGSTELSMPSFLDLLEKIHLGKTGDFILFSPRDQLFISASRPALRLQRAPEIGRDSFHDKVMLGWRGSGVNTDSAGVEMLVVATDIPAAQWILLAEIPTDEALSPVSLIWGTFVRNSVVSASILILILVMFLEYAFRPLRSSAKLMREMAQGDKTLSRIVVKRKDEVGLMLESFNLLVDKLIATEVQMNYLAHHDALTGLPNRRSFMISMRQSMALAGRQANKLALFFVDLDGFKLVNDRYGHAVGDQLLKEVADRLRDGVRQSDLVGRLGGDEFVVLVTECNDRSTAALIASKLVANLSEVFYIGDLVLTVGASIGIAMFPDHSQELETLMTLADKAMYRAKKNGRNCYKFSLETDDEIYEN